MQKVIDKSVIDWDLQYVPWNTGSLGKSPYMHNTIGSGTVIYGGRDIGVPYAHYMYYGEVYGPNIPVFEDDTGEPSGYWSPPNQEKYPTGRDLQYSPDPNPLAGAFWFERMKADHLQDIIEEAKSYVGK